MTRRPKFHYVYGEEYAFCCQSVRVPLEEFAEEASLYGVEDCFGSAPPAVVAEQAVRIRIAIRRDVHSFSGSAIVPASSGDRGSFVAWAWPPPPKEDYPRVEEEA